MTGAFLSGSVLVNTLMPSLKLSKYSFFMIIGIASAHFLLAAGFMLYFFHVPYSSSTSLTSPIVAPSQSVNQTG
jgi:hypothetical protein